MKPTALLTNDDGVGAAFLHALAQALRDAGFRVMVAAPAGERSWTRSGPRGRAGTPP